LDKDVCPVSHEVLWNVERLRARYPAANRLGQRADANAGREVVDEALEMVRRERDNQVSPHK